MNLLIWAWLALVTWPSVYAMYYTKTKEVFRPPTNRKFRENAYFGYSITYDQSHKTLIISAPRENTIGEVYTCNIKHRACTPITKLVKRLSSNYTHDYWFGATVKAGRNFVMMCVPRYTEYSYRYDKYVAEGRCFTYMNGKVKPNEPIDEVERVMDATSLYEATMDSFGWSMDVTDHDSIMVGGPGMFRGRAMLYKNVSDTHPTFIRKTSYSPELNFGYAVASGMFINTKLSFAVGSTYGTTGFGEVTFYEDMKYIQNLTEPLKASEVGSMYGAVLCAATLWDKRTDLLVGAPTYAEEKTYNLGAVYVYLARAFNSTPVFKRKIVGQLSGSMFGSAIISVGDLNGDGKDEIAISAPFENDGPGSVYLYNGADLISDLTESNLKFLQKIESEDSYGKSFGMSLTPLSDYDRNGCKELAIGSPYTNTVVLLRCMAAVVVVTSVKIPNLQGHTSLNKTDFEFEVCLKVKYPSLPKKIKAIVSTKVEMDHRYAKLADTNSMSQFEFNTSLDQKKPKYCTNVSFILPLNGKYDTKISYAISSMLQSDPRTLSNFYSSRVILSDLSVLDIGNTFWAAECGNKTCVPNLMFKPYTSIQHYDVPYTIGSTTEETIHVTVFNYGEVAYDSCVRVHIVGANILTTPSNCVYDDSTVNENRVKCEPPTPIQNNKTWTTGQIVLEMPHLTNLDVNKTINITTLLFDRCEDMYTQIKSINIPVKADPSGINVKGETDIGTVVTMKEDDIEENGKKIKHVFTLTNKGPTDWKELPIQVTLQVQPYIRYDADAPVTVFCATLKSNNTPCKFVSQDETSMTYHCQVKSLMKKVEFAEIRIPMYIVPGTLDGILDKYKNVTISSSVKLQFINDVNKVKSIITILTLQEATVPIETIIVAVVVGVCILIIIALILYRVGFLRRKNKEELEKLKVDIRRQTILRRSTMPSQAHAPETEDCGQVLEVQKDHKHD